MLHYTTIITWLIVASLIILARTLVSIQATLHLRVWVAASSFS